MAERRIAPVVTRRAGGVVLILTACRALAGDAATPDLRVEAQLEPAATYVHAQAIYTLRLYQAVSTRGVAFHAPQSALAELRPVAGEKVDEVARDGRRYRVTERRYLIFPFASGSVPLTGAHVVVQSNAAGASAEQRLEAPSFTLVVQPIPADRQSDDWMPARTLTLTESWQPALTQLPLGKSLRRTIRIEAHGLPASQLPVLQPAADGFAVHPEPPRLEDREDDEGIIGTREQTWLLVPRRAGDLNVPPLQVPWWDTAGNKQQTAQLPGRAFTVVSSAADIVPDTAESAASPRSSPAVLSASPNAAPTASSGTLAAMAPLAALALMMIAAVVAWYRRNQAYLRFRRACLNNDPQAAGAALLEGRRGALRPASNLLAIARQLGGRETYAALAELDRQLYGHPSSAWNGRPLLTALRREHPGLRCHWLRRVPAGPPAQT